jgi:hypothetical protein
MKLALQPANRNPCADHAFPNLSYDEARGPASSRRRPVGDPMELLRSHSKFSPLVFITLGIPLPASPVPIDFYFHDFHTLTNPFSRNSFVYTSIQNPGGCHREVLSRLVLHWRCSASPKPLLFSNLQPLGVSCLSFGTSRPLFSIVCSLFFQNTGVMGVHQ